MSFCHIVLFPPFLNELLPHSFVSPHVFSQVLSAAEHGPGLRGAPRRLPAAQRLEHDHGAAVGHGTHLAHLSKGQVVTFNPNRKKWEGR